MISTRVTWLENRLSWWNQIILILENKQRIAECMFKNCTTYVLVQHFPLSKPDIQIICNGLQKKEPHNFNILILISSGPLALLESKLFNILNISFVENLTEHEDCSFSFVIQTARNCHYLSVNRQLQSADSI